MKSRRRLLPIFFLVFFLALLLIFSAGSVFGKGLTGMLEQAVLPIQQALFKTTRAPASTPESQLREENTKMKTELMKMEELNRENQALRDQFQTEDISSKSLLPAQIIGAKEDAFILDKGSNDGVALGNVLIYKDNVVGRIVKLSAHRSIGELLTKKDASFTVKTSKTAALGIGRGQGQGKFVIDNVVLSDKLEKNDVVISKGDIDENGLGYPPDLVVGKIIAVNKKTSDLFQVAEVEPLIDFEKLEMVFVMTK